MIKINGEEVEFSQFPNGETHIKHLDTSKILDQLVIDFKYEEDGDLIRLMFVKKYLDSINITSNFCAKLNIYYMPYSRMDRTENNSVFTLKYVADFISQLGFDRVVVIEPHSDVTPALLNNSESKFINFKLIEKVKQEVLFNEEEDYIVFPDSGASKRYDKIKVKNSLFCNKVRDFQTGEIKSLEVIGDVEGTQGKTAIICDDLSSYGGTFVHTAKALRKLGFNKVYLLVAHAENSIFKGKLFDYIDKVFTTDSILTEQDNWGNKKYEKQIKIYKMEELV